MLALAEQAIFAAGLDWALCDTDSMAIAKPELMPEAEFLEKAKGISDRFSALNPYEKKGPLLKIEDVNYRPGTKEIIPLYCLAISSKRYVLFNLDNAGLPVIRKASAHGLGHLSDPYNEADAPKSIPAPIVPLNEIGVQRWQYDLWFKIISAAQGKNPAIVPLDYHPNLLIPSVSQYSATTPELLNWFKTHNSGHNYAEQVKPFNFLCALQANSALNLVYSAPVIADGISSKRKPRNEPIKPISPYFKDARQAANSCFDRDTGKTINPSSLKTYATALAQYHLSPEHKFQNGDYLDIGTTKRRFIIPSKIRYIGKESNKWEEQFFLGLNGDHDIEYGANPENGAKFMLNISQAVTAHGERKLAESAGISRTTIRDLMVHKNPKMSAATTTKINSAISKLQAEIQEIDKLRQMALEEMLKVGNSEFARRLNVDASNLFKCIIGNRKIGKRLEVLLSRYFEKKPKD